jgi:hypothetical protein
MKAKAAGVVFSGHSRECMLKSMILIQFFISSLGYGRTSDNGCGADALSALPDRPVALTRVERAENDAVRVAWPLRMNAEDGEDTFSLQTGSEFDVLRCLPPGRWIALGQGEVLARNGALVEGSLTLAGSAKSVDRGVSEELVSAGNLYPMPMVGDVVVVRRKEIQQAKKILPRVTIPVSQLFAGSDKDGAQLELTSSGQESLRQLLSEKFSDARGKLLIEVHAQRTGSRQQLRTETSMRAESIERFLRYEFGIAKDQLVSVGHGSDGFVPGFVAAGKESDFVVLRMFPQAAR